MDFKIDRRSPGIGNTSDSSPLKVRAGTSEVDKVKSDLGRDLKVKSKEDLVSFNKVEAATGDTLAVSNIKDALATAENAINAIEKTLQKRLYYAREVESGPFFTERNETLDDASYSDERLEAERILSEASSNGRNPISGTSNYSVASVFSAERDAVSTGAVVVPEGSTRSRLENSSSASSEADRLEQVISGFRSTQAGYSAAAAKAARLEPLPTSEAGSAENRKSDAVESIDAAKALAGEIASKLGAARGDEEAAQKLIEASAGNLELDRVKTLLS